MICYSSISCSFRQMNRSARSVEKCNVILKVSVDIGLTLLFHTAACLWVQSRAAWWCSLQSSEYWPQLESLCRENPYKSPIDSGAPRRLMQTQTWYCVHMRNVFRVEHLTEKHWLDVEGVFRIVHCDNVLTLCEIVKCQELELRVVFLAKVVNLRSLRIEKVFIRVVPLSRWSFSTSSSLYELLQTITAAFET